MNNWIGAAIRRYLASLAAPWDGFLNVRMKIELIWYRFGSAEKAKRSPNRTGYLERGTCRLQKIVDGAGIGKHPKMHWRICDICTCWKRQNHAKVVAGNENQGFHCFWANAGKLTKRHAQ